MSDIATYLPGILVAFTAVLLALMSPGPNILAVTGLTALLTANSAVLIVVKVLGGCYLLWLGLKEVTCALLTT